MTFLNPLLLFGLLGMAVPVLIHLLSRRTARRVLVRARVVQPGRAGATTPTSRSYTVHKSILAARPAAP